MIFYQIIIPKKDEVYVPAINRLVGRSNGMYDATETQTAIVYQISFPSRELLENFKEAVSKRLSKKLY